MMPLVHSTVLTSQNFRYCQAAWLWWCRSRSLREQSLGCIVVVMQVNVTQRTVTWLHGSGVAGQGHSENNHMAAWLWWCRSRSIREQLFCCTVAVMQVKVTQRTVTWLHGCGDSGQGHTENSHLASWWWWCRSRSLKEQSPGCIVVEMLVKVTQRTVTWLHVGGNAGQDHSENSHLAALLWRWRLRSLREQSHGCMVVVL